MEINWRKLRQEPNSLEERHAGVLWEYDRLIGDYARARTELSNERLRNAALVRRVQSCENAVKVLAVVVVALAARWMFSI